MDNAAVNGRRSHSPSTRKLIQLYSALQHNAHLKGFLSGEIYQGKAKYACVPGLNCYSCPGAVGACPLGALQNALASAGHRAGWYVIGIILLFGTLLGRTICGWICPFGLIQELLHKVPTFKIRKSRLTRALTWLKYAVLTVFAAAVPLWYGLKHGIPVPAFCKYICPAGTLEGAAGLLIGPAGTGLFGMLGAQFTRKFAILMIAGLSCVFCYRSFCRFLCPLGAVYGLFNRFSAAGVRVEKEQCSHCGACVMTCGMDVRHVGDRECIHCARCVSVCPEKAISLKAGGVVLMAPAAAKSAGEESRRRKTGRMTRTAALAVLCAALVWFNFLDPAVRAEAGSAADSAGTAGVSAEAASAGAGVGMRPEDFSVTCLDGTRFSLGDTRGIPVFINLWATYCTPCIQELPYFAELNREHEGDIAVLAVHSALVTEDPAGFISGRGWNIPFATDTEEGTVWRIVGGSSTLPQTIVLDRNGVVIYNQTGSVTPEMLEALYERASGNGGAAGKDAPDPEPH